MLVRHPSLLIEAVRTWFALSRRGALGTDQAYLEWRAYTAYGDHRATANTHDLLYFLAWRKRMRGLRKWGQVA